MPVEGVLAVQQRLRELGRIRMGDQVPTSRGRKRPRKLKTFRLTSQQRALIDAAAELYGGDVTPWRDDGRDEWQVTVEHEAIPCQVPPDQPLTQWMELWKAGGCERRCDGVTEMLQMRPCVCLAKHTVRTEDNAVDERATRFAIDEAAKRPAKDGGADGCTIHTRLNVWLHELPGGLGVWRLETHGRYAAAELQGVAHLLSVARAHGRSVPATLRITQRRIKRPGRPPNEFIVPALDIPETLDDLLTTLGVPLGAQGAIADVSNPAPALTPGRRGTQRVPLGDPPALPSGDVGQPVHDRRPPIGDAAAPDTPAEPDAAGGQVIDVGSPPMPDPPAEPDDAAPPQPITEAQRGHLMGRFAAVGITDDDHRHDVTWWVTNAAGGAPAVRSSKDLDGGQLDQLLSVLDLITYGLAAWGSTDTGDEAVVRIESGQPTMTPIRMPLDVAAVQTHLASLPTPQVDTDQGAAGADDQLPLSGDDFA